MVSLLKDDIAKLTEKRIQLENEVAAKGRKIEENEEIWSEFKQDNPFVKLMYRIPNGTEAD